jgi:hypothetical protein
MSQDTPLPPHLLAIIAASIHATFAGKVRIVAVIPIFDADWAREGRRDIFTSHRIR